jgi:hypothetical protein
MTKLSTRYTNGTSEPVDATSREVNTVIIKNNYSQNIQVTIFYKNGQQNEVVFPTKTVTMRSVPKGLSINTFSIESRAGSRQFINTTQFDTQTLIFNVDKKFQILRDGLALQSASKKMQGDKEVVLAAVKEDGLVLKYASKKMQGDKEVVLAAVKQMGYALKYASKKMQGDKEVVLAALLRDGFALRSASKKMKGDKEVVLAALLIDGMALQSASKKMKGDKEVVLAAVKQMGNALKFASNKMKNDKEVVLAAVKEDVKAFEYASDKMKSLITFKNGKPIIKPKIMRKK